MVFHKVIETTEVLLLLPLVVSDPFKQLLLNVNQVTQQDSIIKAKETKR